MKVICDTTVWYLLIDEPEYFPVDHELIMTATNFYDWFSSNWMDQNHSKHARLLSSYSCAKKSHSTRLIVDPFDYPAIQLNNYESKDNTIALLGVAEHLLDCMLKGVYKHDLIGALHLMFTKTKKGFVKDIEDNLQYLYSKCSNSSNSFDSRKYDLDKECLIDSIKNWIMSFPGFEDVGKHEMEWDKFERFITVYKTFLNTKPINFEENSVIDLVNFLYLIGSNNLYWTEDNEFLEYIRQSYGPDLPNFIYPNGKLTKKYFEI